MAGKALLERIGIASSMIARMGSNNAVGLYIPEIDGASNCNIDNIVDMVKEFH